MDDGERREEIGRIGPRHAEWVSIAARTTGNAAAASDWALDWFDELLVEAATITPMSPDNLLASLRRSATTVWPRLSSGDMPTLAQIPDEDRRPEACAQYDSIRKVVEIDLLALAQLALLLGHGIPPKGELAVGSRRIRPGAPSICCSPAKSWKGCSPSTLRSSWCLPASNQGLLL